jgi:protein tyrosine phosphatase
LLIQWTGWSDLKKPLGEESEGLFRGLVQECLGLIEKNEMFLIHCSAGIGRTGTLGTVIDSLRCAEKYKELSVFEIVENLRKHRMYCVQTFEQYRFVYQELKRYFSS